jgi:hypothetical protein
MGLYLSRDIVIILPGKAYSDLTRGYYRLKRRSIEVAVEVTVEVAEVLHHLPSAY